MLNKVVHKKSGATIFSYQVKDPERFGVVEFDNQNKVISIDEKPKYPKSHSAITGLYFYDNRVVKIAKSIKPSSRGELEITDINKFYMQSGNLNVERLGRGFAWLDTGTFESLLDASHFVQNIEKRQGYKIACLEEIAYNQGWIPKNQLKKIAFNLSQNSYGEYLFSLIQKKN